MSDRPVRSPQLLREEAERYLRLAQNLANKKDSDTVPNSAERSSG